MIGMLLMEKGPAGTDCLLTSELLIKTSTVEGITAEPDTVCCGNNTMPG